MKDPVVQGKIVDASGAESFFPLLFTVLGRIFLRIIILWQGRHSLGLNQLTCDV